jgi:hypothetical protein
VSIRIGFRGALGTSRLRRLEVSGEVVRQEVHWDRTQPCGFAVAGRTKVLNARRKGKDVFAGRAAFELDFVSRG